ncbi:hypothetical protein JHK87_001021 [Glycine soja]|nr:hypothetical protein JHK87_001021 [Glycine soja]
MDRFGRIVVQIQNLNPEVALYSMLLALQPDKWANSSCKKPLVAWMSCANKPKATSRWKKHICLGTKSDKSDNSTIGEKESPRLTHASRTRGTSRTSASLSQNGPSTSMVPAPQAHQTQGLPLVSLAKIHYERVAGRFSKGLAKPKVHPW